MNKLGTKGIQYLTKGDLPQLKELWLSNLKDAECELSDTIIKFLSKGQWPNLKMLTLSKNLFKFR